jgi:hypothetical protein
VVQNYKIRLAGLPAENDGTVLVLASISISGRYSGRIGSQPGSTRFRLKDPTS